MRVGGFSRRTAALAAAAAVAGGAVLFATTGAGAATEDGLVLNRVQGSAYTTEQVMYAAAKGAKPAVYFYEIKNTGSVQTQYQVVLVPQSGNGIWHLYNGKMQVATNTFLTPSVAPGGSYQLTAQTSVPAGGLSPGNNNATMQFSVADTGLDLGTAYMYVFQDTKFTGSTAADFFGKSGSQGWVGGTAYIGVESAAVKARKAAHFSIRVQNDSSSSEQERLVVRQVVDGTGCALSDFTTSVKLGSRDVTDAMSNSGLVLTLAPGKHVLLKESVTYIGPDLGCQGLTSIFQPGQGGISTAAITLAPVAAS